MNAHPIEIALVTGMSGAGRSTAARALEDLGWFVVDNLPPQLLDELVGSVVGEGTTNRLAVVIDVRGGSRFEGLEREIDKLRESGNNVRVLFLEATNETLVRRFESNRRPHPLQGGGRVLDGLEKEREALANLRGGADLVVDTSSLNVHDLRRKIEALLPGRAVIHAVYGIGYRLEID